MPSSLYNGEFLLVLRRIMKSASLWAVVVPTADPHNSEYVAPQFMLRAALTNFGGSAGTAVVTQEKALLWTDGRYHLEAAACMPPPWELVKDGNVGVPSVTDWLDDEADGRTVGMDSFVATVNFWETLSRKVNMKPSSIARDAYNEARKRQETLTLTSNEFFEIKKIYLRPTVFCGETCEEKTKRVLVKCKAAKCDAILLSALDDIAWLTNLRGDDVNFNPVFISYGWIDTDSGAVSIFVNEKKITDDVRNGACKSITFYDYDEISSFLHKHAYDKVVGIDEYQTSFGMLELLKENNAKVRRISGIVKTLKGVKNSIEIKGFYDCHVRDGCALTRYLAWLYEEIAVKGRRDITEVSGPVVLEGYRREEEHYVQLSFESISCSGPNGAIMHYRASSDSARTLVPEELYLIDSGAQYYDGTTDVTRVMCFTSSPSAEYKETYTAVLKGHIQLATTVFPNGVSGHRLDSFARMHLWRLGLDYAHGTGHGVGSFLNVHEGPHSIPARLPTKAVPLEAAMIVSNEPGYYKDGCYGIRIENLVEVVPTETKFNAKGDINVVDGGMKDSLTFNNITLVPYHRALIDVNALTTEEKVWVDNYHKLVRNALLPHIRRCNDVVAEKYIMEWTEPL